MSDEKKEVLTRAAVYAQARRDNEREAREMLQESLPSGVYTGDVEYRTDLNISTKTMLAAMKYFSPGLKFNPSQLKDTGEGGKRSTQYAQRRRDNETLMRKVSKANLPAHLFTPKIMDRSDFNPTTKILIVMAQHLETVESEGGIEAGNERGGELKASDSGQKHESDENSSDSDAMSTEPAEDVKDRTLPSTLPLLSPSLSPSPSACESPMSLTLDSSSTLGRQQQTQRSDDSEVMVRWTHFADMPLPSIEKREPPEMLRHLQQCARRLSAKAELMVMDLEVIPDHLIQLLDKISDQVIDLIHIVEQQDVRSLSRLN